MSRMTSIEQSGIYPDLLEDFTALVDKMLVSDRRAMGERGYEFLKQNYLVENTYDVIMKHFY